MSGKKLVQVEEYGLEAVPVEERSKPWWDLFFIRAGTHITLPIFLAGSLFIADFSWLEALILVVTGNLFLVVLDRAVGGIGLTHGLSTAVLARASFGWPLGAWIPALSLIVSLLGWFAINTELAGQAVSKVIANTTGFENETLAIGLMGLGGAIPAILGFDKIKWLGALSVPLLLAMVLWVFLEILASTPISTFTSHVPSGNRTMAEGMDWVIGTLIVGAFYASDFARRIRSIQHLWIAYLAGIGPVVFLLAVGAVSGMATGNWNPIAIVEQLGLGIPALLVIILASWTTMDAILYSGGLALNSVFTRLTRWQATMLLSVVGALLAMFRLTEHLNSFLHLLSSIFVPMIGIVVSDYYFVRGRRLRVSQLYEKIGEYSYLRGVNPVAVVTAAIGVAAAVLTPPSYVASLVALATSAVVYYVGMKLFYPGQFAPRETPGESSTPR